MRVLTSLGDIEQRKQKNPNDIDEVPVQPDALHALQFLVFRRVRRNEQHDDHSRQHVQPVQPGHACNSNDQNPPEESTNPSWISCVHSNPLTIRKIKPPSDGQAQKFRGLGAVVGVRGLVRQHREQARREQHERIERARLGVRVRRGDAPTPDAPAGA